MDTGNFVNAKLPEISGQPPINAFKSGLGPILCSKSFVWQAPALVLRSYVGAK